MALAIDGSTPAVATQTNAATTTVSQTVTNPPNGALLYIRWSWNSQPGTDPTQPTITDNLGAHLTYTLIDWSHRGDGPTTDGQAADWWAVSNGSTLTITVTAGVSGSNNGGALSVTVLTGADTTTPVGAHGKSGSTSAASIAQSYTAQATGGWGFIADCDWDLKGAQTAGTGCTLSGGADGSADVGTLITYGFVRRSSADDSNGVSNTLNVTIPATSTNLRWVYAEIMPAATTTPTGGYQPLNPLLPPLLLFELAARNQATWTTDALDQTGTSIALADSGAGDDSSFTVAAAVPLAETGAGSDALAVTATAPLTDTGSAADAIAVTAAVPLTDSGSAADSISGTAAVALSDTGSTADSLAVAASAPLSDSGSAAETIAVTATVPLTDAGSAADSITVNTGSNPALPDSGSASDSLTVVVTTPLSDFGSALDALSVSVALVLTDAGSAADVLMAVTGPTNQPGTQTPSTTSGRVGANTASPRQNPATASGRAGMSSAAARINPSTSGGHA